MEQAAGLEGKQFFFKPTEFITETFINELCSSTSYHQIQ